MSILRLFAQSHLTRSCFAVLLDEFWAPLQRSQETAPICRRTLVTTHGDSTPRGFPSGLARSQHNFLEEAVSSEFPVLDNSWSQRANRVNETKELSPWRGVFGSCESLNAPTSDWPSRLPQSTTAEQMLHLLCRSSLDPTRCWAKAAVHPPHISRQSISSLQSANAILLVRHLSATTPVGALSPIFHSLTQHQTPFRIRSHFEPMLSQGCANHEVLPGAAQKVEFSEKRTSSSTSPRSDNPSSGC